MPSFFVNIDDDAAEWLSVKIDDLKPTLLDVAQAVLQEASRGLQEGAGSRPCGCGKLERLSREEASPVIFDSALNEYHLLLETPPDVRSEHLIRYCLFCGGRAPASRRAQLFAKVSHEEVRRLNALCTGIRTFGDAISRFGQPDSYRAEGLIISAMTDDGAEKHSAHRTISYESLSDVADVWFKQHGEVVSVSFAGKFLGRLETPVP